VIEVGNTRFDAVGHAHAVDFQVDEVRQAAMNVEQGECVQRMDMEWRPLPLGPGFTAGCRLPAAEPGRNLDSIQTGTADFGVQEIEGAGN
jgi:hypothetical protein